LPAILHPKDRRQRGDIDIFRTALVPQPSVLNIPVGYTVSRNRTAAAENSQVIAFLLNREPCRSYRRIIPAHPGHDKYLALVGGDRVIEIALGDRQEGAEEKDEGEEFFHFKRFDIEPGCL